MFIDPRDRARIMGLIYVLMLAFSAPFGWIAGVLSSLNRAFPFYLNIGVFCVFILVIAFSEDIK
jgi:low affinity Fe/Cu permease